jgi:hypothetical protein
MTFDPAVRRAAEARALNVALAIAGRAGWQFERAGPMLATPFAGYLYVHTSQLLLVPTSAGLPYAVRLVDGAVREARSDALIVSTADAQPAFALGLWSRSGTLWQVPVTPVLSANGVLWMVTTLSGVAPAGTAFPMRRGRIVDLPAPWETAADRAAGEKRAAAWLAAMMG